MKKVILGLIVGLFLGWLTVPIVTAVYSVEHSDGTFTNEDDDFRASHAYKWYLQQMLGYMKSIDQSLKDLNTNMKAVKDKLHA